MPQKWGMRKEVEYYHDKMERGRETKGVEERSGKGEKMKGSKERKEIAH